MDKYFLLIYTDIGCDGLRHSYHAWFQTEKELRAFENSDRRRERELALEILTCRILK